MASRRGASRGQGLVEFALVVIFIFLLVSGIIGIGNAFFIHLALRDAAQEGAAYAAVAPTNTTQITQRAKDAMGGTLNPGDVSVTVTELNPGVFCAGINPMTLRSNGIEVQVSYNMPIVVPFLGAIVGSDTWTLTGTSRDTILIPSC
ncbi:MAG: TadE family protein [Anaerolineales bacterium]